MPTILAVDDSASMRSTIALTLRRAGYDVVEAADGREGLDKARATQFEAVLTDQNMPQLDGLGLVRELRALASYKSVPILMLTTESSDEMKQKGRAAGATGWIVKPFDPNRLVDVLKKVVK
jgi:two-component system, chemotaxis family, chemotaxis protein CheY